MTKIIFSNIVNQLMIGQPTNQYARGMNAVTPRKLWLAEPGDAVITPVAPSNYFRDYVCDVLGVNPRDIFTFSPIGDDATYLSDRLLNDSDYTSFKDYVSNHPTAKMQVFATDQPVIDFARKHGLGLMFYDHELSEAQIANIYSLNSKSGFRKTVRQMGMQVAPGFSCDGLEALLTELAVFAKQHKKVIVKFDRSSNGYGHLVFETTGLERSDLEEKIRQHLAAFPEQPKSFTVEKFIDSIAMPSVEVEVLEHGTQITYICDQRCRNHAYSGMVTPPIDLSEHVIQQLKIIGEAFAKKVHALGFRGYCDVDACLGADGKLYVTETNLRRTAGTFIDALIKRFLKASSYDKKKVWIQDARLTQDKIDFAFALKQLEDNDLAFDPSSVSGILLYVDTFNIDEKLRYIIIANNMNHANELENKLMAALPMR